MEISKRPLQDDTDVESNDNYKKSRISDVLYSELNTVNKKRLDFDIEKICSVTSSSLNVYCCLICGKYLQGRREHSPAFLHSVNENHFVFINLDTLKVYNLPTDIEIKDQGKIQLINDIRYAIYPRFDKSEIIHFPQRCFDLNNKLYINGYVGISNVQSNGFVQSILQLLAHIEPIRDWFLLNEIDSEESFMKNIKLIIRKLWSTKLFKSHISADEFFAFLSIHENFEKMIQDPKIFLLKIINSIIKSSQELGLILKEQLLGKVSISTSAISGKEANSNKVVKSPFWLLTLDLPTQTVFRNALEVNDLPQVKLGELLIKFNGINEYPTLGGVKKYKILKLPRYLILHFNRFDNKEKTPVKDRNQTLVEFPTLMELQKTKYQLIANIIHEPLHELSVDNTSNEDLQSKWKAQLLNEKDEQWYEIDGTEVKIKERELLFLSETYLQVWKKITVD
ncbi:hypothetical protein Kpol_1056p45 [Vanderwaltozyma polyspora DSM 70294]|uniref:UBP-type domain-containing protein n=1 Tax=Vanderwaltozyma polyspora (strain ATCC 22028 / DSM 70294 / BCRC 21397 / CBS 2163 / NBRC 10782 / NRRL Y-8283 / UCD 57-17) TaxID=436907 RepID=A7TLQ2_VANPO|nr:uncharacterized protein Kpol_1056p45 [Vanderwaltozyma polyspora DSM 70294]EDO16844.1 hypothetical protein Kpol_1056p45 [Vanderwaltozyma polyspora DSM 70294]